MKSKKYAVEHIQVRGTGDWSSDSKLSAIQNGYWEDPDFEALNKSAGSVPKRTSLICRVYYVRFRVCDYFLRKIISDLEDQGPVQIVSLGCGMDSMFFRLAELGNHIQFFEIDFPTVIAKKSEIISSEENLCARARDRLRLVPADLRDLPALQESLVAANFDFGRTTVFYSECVVNYLKPSENDAILRWIAATFPKSIWLAYEQCFPSDTFGQIMVSHFEKNGCPILSVQQFGDITSQKRQLRDAGFKYWDVLNVWNAFTEIAKDEFSDKINMQQQFDEYEAFVATCSHYSVRIGSQIKLKTVSLKSLDSGSLNTNVIKNVRVEPWSSPIAGHSALMLGGDLLIIGGSNEQSERLRQASKCKLSSSSGNFSVDLVESFTSLNFERLHSAVASDPSNCQAFYVFGGRKSPKAMCGPELIRVEYTGTEFSHNALEFFSQDCPTPRWRHSMVSFTLSGVSGEIECENQDYIFLFGGKSTTEGILGDCWIFNIRKNEWDCIRPKKDQDNFPSARHSHSICADPKTNSIYLVGGISSDDLNVCEDSFWKFECINQTWTRLDCSNLSTNRFGHVAVIHEDNLLIVGGYGNSPSIAVDQFLALINLDSKLETFYGLDLGPYQLFLPFGFSAFIYYSDDPFRNSEKNAHLIIFGGGGNCFSFGTHYNKILLEIKLPLT